MPLPVGILYNIPSKENSPYYLASQDVLFQVEAIEKSLNLLDYKPIRLPFSSDIMSFVESVRSNRINVVFNLCESVDEDPKLVGHVVALLDLLGVKYTGSPLFSLTLSTDKVLTKHILGACGVRTPDFLVFEGKPLSIPLPFPFPVILKPRFEDASIGIDQESIIEDQKTLPDALNQAYQNFGPLLVEEYVAGREFNVSLFGFPRPKVLPIAEIDFSGFPCNMYNIVGYKAKWDKNSFEYHHTPRKFPEDLDRVLVDEIYQTALTCFDVSELRDYARIDFRLSDKKTLYTIDINANPCLSPDAGFVAALRKSGIDYVEFVRKMLEFTDMRNQKT